MESIGNYVWVIFLLMALQPMIQKFLITRKRQSQIRKIQAKTKTRVITMIHRQESGNIIGFRVNRHIDIEDAQTIIGAIERTPADQPIDLIMHTPGGHGPCRHADCPGGQGAFREGDCPCAVHGDVRRNAYCACR